MKVFSNGELRDATHEEEMEILAAQEAMSSPELEPEPSTLAPVLCRLANLTMDDGAISSVKTDAGISFALVRPNGAIRALFAEPMPDSDYSWGVDITSGRVSSINRQMNYIEFTLEDVVEPCDISVKIYCVV